MPKPGEYKYKQKKQEEEKKESVVSALVPKPSDRYIDNSRDPAASGNKSYYEAKSHNPLDKGRRWRGVKDKASDVVDALTSGLAGSRQFGGFSDEVKSYVPAKTETPKKPTGNAQWAEDLSTDSQRAEQREQRRTSATKPNVEPPAAKPAGFGTEDQRAEQRAQRAAGATGDRSEWFPEMSAPVEKPTAPAVSSGYAGFMDDEDDGVDEVPGDTFPGTDIPMEKSALEKRQEEKARLEDEKRKLQGEYDDYYQSIMWGTWGVDYGDKELAHLKELEGQIKDYDDQLKAYDGNVDWDGRDELIAEYRELYRKKNSRSAGLSPEEQARMQEVLGLLQAGDEAAGNEEQYYGGFGERASGALQGTLGGVGSNLVNAAGTAIDAMAQNYARSYSTDEYLADQLMGSDYFRDRSGEEAAAAVHEAMTPVYDYADALGGKATEELEKAKGGLSEFGKAGVDIASNVVQMGCDAGLGYISGAGSLPVMFARTFGGSAQEARQAGADIDQQVLYGLIKGGIEIGTEKLFGGDAGIYGIGSFDNAVERTIRHLTESDTAMSALRMLAGANQEGLEEVISDLLSPFAERVYNDQAIRDLIANGYPIDQLLYDYILGASVGFLGEVGSVAKGDYAAQNAENHAANEAEARVASQMDGVIDALTGSQQNTTQPAEGLTAEDQRNEQRQQRQQTPDEILAEAATPKVEEDQAVDEQTPEAPQEEAPIEEAPAEEETPAEEQPTPEEMGEKQQERKPETPAEILADEASKQGKAAEAPSEAAESKMGEDHESVPPSTQESPSEAQEELNNGSADSEQSSPVQSGQDGGTIEERRKAERSEHHIAARSVEEANRALKEIERFEQNPDYRSSSYSNAENARAVVDKTINDLRSAGLTNADELRNQAQELRERSKEAQRMVDRIEANTPEGEDIADPEYNYWYDEVDAAEDEAYAVDAIADFVEAHPEVFTETPSGGTMKTDESKGGSEREQVDSGGDRSDSPVDGDAGTDAGDLRKTRKDDTGRESQVVGGKSAKDLESQADYDAAKDKRDQVNRRFDRGQATVESEITLDGGEVIDIKYAPGWVKRAVEKAQKEAPDCRFVIATKTSSIAYYSHGNGVIVINPGRLANWALSITQKTGVPHSAANAVLHERVHYWLERSDYKASEILEYIQSDFANDPEALTALYAAYDAHKTNYHSDVANGYSDVAEMQNALWEEVIADLAADLPRAFVKDGKINPAYERVKASAEKYVQNYVVPSYRINNGLDIYNGKPASGGPAAPSGPNDPGANKSWADSLTAQEPPAENDSGEQPGDDMTPLNEQSRERDEERRENQKTETKKKLGKDNYDRMNKALEKLDAWDKEYTERYGETAKDEDGHDIVDDDLNETKTSAVHELATRVRSMLEGEESVQSFAEYYESLRPAEGETNQTDANYLYDGALAEMLNQLADAERALNLSEKGSPADGDVARDEFAKASEAFAGSLETRLGRLEEQFKNRIKANDEITSHTKGEKSGLKNSIDRLKKKFWETQMRVDTFFKMLGGFSEKSKVMNDLAQRGADSTIKRNNVRNSGYQFFHDLSTNPETAKAWKDIESGKTKGNVDIPGLGKASMNYELAMLKTLMTNGALDHIARFGAQFVNEADYYKGYNNNGRGETESYQAQHRLTRDVLDQMAKENLQAANELAERTGGKGKKINGKAIYDEKIRILKELRSELMKDVSSNEVALAGYNASIEAMKYLANEINDVTLRLYGVAKALQGSNYWPMQVIGRGNNLQFLNNNAFTMEEASYLQHRKGGSGALQINPFAEVMSSYIDRASKFVGFGELNSDLMMMSKEIGVGYGKHDSEKQSIQSTIQKQAGSSAAKWMTRYMETLNGTAKQPSKLGSMLRSNLASSSLSLNPGVALKQSPSYFNAAGIVDLDILIKNRLITLGALRSAKSYDSNPLIQEINKRTGVLESRKSGTVVLGEQDGRALFGKLKNALPNWITNRDVSTVSNLALACAEQVKRDNPGIDTKSDAFYEQTAKLLEQAVIKSQPVYDAEFRPDYLRSDNEVVRMLSMFRTQQSQNLNQLMQAYGELEAARREGGDVKAAEKKRNQVVAGYAMSQVAFSVLSTAARALTHKTKDYEDEEGNIDLGKVAKRAGLDFLTTAGGVVWFGDTLSKVAIDAATGLYAKATGKKDAATSEFFSMSDNTISVIDDVIGSTIKVFQNPTPKTIKNEVFDLAQSVGLPARNFYNILNSAFMYGTDALHKNPSNYDDAIDMWQTESKKSDTTRAKDTTEAAVKAYTKGDRKRGDTLLATLDTSSKDVCTAVKSAASAAYVRGDIDEMTFKGILRNYANVDYGKIDNVVHNATLDRTIDALIGEDPKTYSGVADSIKEAKEATKEGESKSDAAARVILDAAMSKEGQAAFMEKYTSADYFKAYEAVVNPRRPDLAVDLLLGIDTNHNDTFSQEELYSYYLEHESSESYVKAIWNANGFSQTWDKYKAGKKTEYDKLSLDNSESYQFGAAEEKLKELKSGNTMHIQTGGGDPAMFKIIGGMGLSAKDTDTVVDKYVSSKTKTNYHVLRDGGYEPAKAMELLTAVDTDGKGTISQKELWAYYRAHKDDEAVIEALWNAQGYKKNWQTYKKGKH